MEQATALPTCRPSCRPCVIEAQTAFLEFPYNLTTSTLTVATYISGLPDGTNTTFTSVITKPSNTSSGWGSAATTFDQQAPLVWTVDGLELTSGTTYAQFTSFAGAAFTPTICEPTGSVTDLKLPATTDPAVFIVPVEYAVPDEVILSVGEYLDSLQTVADQLGGHDASECFSSMALRPLVEPACVTTTERAITFCTTNLQNSTACATSTGTTTITVPPSTYTSITSPAPSYPKESALSLTYVADPAGPRYLGPAVSNPPRPPTTSPKPNPPPITPPPQSPPRSSAVPTRTSGIPPSPLPVELPPASTPSQGGHPQQQPGTPGSPGQSGSPPVNPTPRPNTPPPGSPGTSPGAPSSPQLTVSQDGPNIVVNGDQTLTPGATITSNGQTVIIGTSGTLTIDGQTTSLSDSQQAIFTPTPTPGVVVVSTSHGVKVTYTVPEANSRETGTSTKTKVGDYVMSGMKPGGSGSGGSSVEPTQTDGGASSSGAAGGAATQSGLPGFTGGTSRRADAEAIPRSIAGIILLLVFPLLLSWLA